MGRIQLVVVLSLSPLISCLLNVDLRFNEIFGKSLRLKVIEDFHINEVMNNH